MQSLLHPYYYVDILLPIKDLRGVASGCVGSRKRIEPLTLC